MLKTLHQVLTLAASLLSLVAATPALADLKPPPSVAAEVCLSFEDRQSAFDPPGAAAWQRFIGITQEARHRPLNLGIALRGAKRDAFQLDDGQGTTAAYQLWAARTQYLLGKLTTAHSGWTGTPLTLAVTELGDYAGSRCDATIKALFPLEAKPQFCPDTEGRSCWVQCDGVACERR
jgi:hypothetical protein